MVCMISILWYIDVCWLVGWYFTSSHVDTVPLAIVVAIVRKRFHQRLWPQTNGYPVPIVVAAAANVIALHSLLILSFYNFYARYVYVS
jgi:hypothetical protein